MSKVKDFILFTIALFALVCFWVFIAQLAMAFVSWDASHIAWLKLETYRLILVLVLAFMITKIGDL